jgi:hypothetical protein
VADVASLADPPPFVATGDLVGPAAFAATLLLVGLAGRTGTGRRELDIG